MQTVKLGIQSNSNLSKQLKSLHLNCDYDGHPTFTGTIAIPPGQSLSLDEIKGILGHTLDIGLDVRSYTRLNVGFFEDTAHSLNQTFVDQILINHDENSGQQLTITGYAPTVFLDCAPGFQAFSNKTLQEIAKTLLEDKHCPYRVASKAGNYRFDWAIQCQETTYNFLKRLCSKTGELECFFDGEEFVIDDLTAPTEYEVVLLTEAENLSNISLSFDTYPQAFSVQAPDYVGDRILSAPQQAVQSSSSLINTVLNASKAYPKQRIFSPFSVANQASVDSISHRMSAAQSNEMVVFSGHSTEASMKVGSQIQIESTLLDGELGQQNWTVLSVSHRYQEPGIYSNSFTAIPSSLPFNLPMSYNKPSMGPLSAIVEEVNGDPKKLGRVRVSIVGDPNKSISPWLRLLQPSTSWYTRPNVGDHVQILGEQLNPECNPIVLGSFFTGNRDASFWDGKQGFKNDDFECYIEKGSLRIKAEQFYMQLNKTWKLIADKINLIKR